MSAAKRKLLYSQLESIRGEAAALAGQLRIQNDVDAAEHIASMANSALGVFIELLHADGENPHNHDVNPAEGDVDRDTARALHRVVRAMHDGHCPMCGHMDNPNRFVCYYDAGPSHTCPSCGFNVKPEECVAALQAFQPYLQKSLNTFLEWRTKRHHDAGQKPTRFDGSGRNADLPV